MAWYQNAECLQADGTVWSWGIDTPDPVLGPPVSAKEPRRKAGGFTDVVWISAGTAIRANGTVCTWPQGPQNTPVRTSGVHGVKKANGDYVIIADGTVWADPGITVPGLTGVVSVGGGSREGGGNGYALTSDGSVWQLNGTAKPTKVQGLPRIVALAPTSGAAMYFIAA